jgi:hypothetical protein
MKEREPTGTPRGVKVAILALGVLLVAGFALFGGAMSVTKDLRGGAKSAAVAFAKDAALGISPEGVQKSPPALDALRLKAGFERPSPTCPDRGTVEWRASRFRPATKTSPGWSSS